MTRDAPVVQLPEQVIEALRQLLNDGESYQWATGDFIIEVLEEFPRVSRSELIKQMADRTGSDRSTLRDRHNMSMFYPSKVRKEFDMLTWSQLRACKSALDEWRDYAEWAAKHMPAPVAVIRARIKNEGNDQPAWVHRWDSMQHLAQRLVDDRATPAKVKKVCRLVCKTML